jgi:hypothetical protein
MLYLQFQDNLPGLHAKSSVISYKKHTAFIVVFIFAFSYADTSKGNGIVI